jgi:DNA-binding transcriptional regulator YhcF (GntR family)
MKKNSDYYKNMLAQIFGSKARVKILKTFLSKPEQKYYTRQLARDLELQVNSVRRELENLQSIGLIRQEEGEEHDNPVKNSKNEKKYFIAERNFLLFGELKSLFAKANLLSCQDFLKNIEQIGDIKQLWLSGLFSGDSKSPTDVLIVGKIKKDAFLKRLQALESDLNKEINYTLMNESEYTYRLDINDIFLHNIQNSRHLKIIDSENQNRDS